MAATKLDGPHLPGLLGDTLDWPFFEDRHRRFAAELSAWADATLPGLPHDDVDAACRARVTALGEGGFLRAELIFPPEYPLLPPKMKFITPMWHPNIYADGTVCISILHAPGKDEYGYEDASERWLPVHTVESIVSLPILAWLATTSSSVY